MSLLIPPAVNYPSPLVMLPSKIGYEPLEGRQMVPCEIDWATMGGANNCVLINMQNNATMNFSRICSLKIDNSLSGVDVQFVFPDTSEVVTVPAYAPTTIVPVFTNQTMFYVVAIGPEATDITRFQILNFVPPPLSLPGSAEQTVAFSGAFQLGIGSTALIASNISGTLEAITVQLNVVNAGSAFNYLVELKDGLGNELPSSMCGGLNNSIQFQTLINLNPVSLRFINGVNLIVSNGTSLPATVANGLLSASLLYRTP